MYKSILIALMASINLSSVQAQSHFFQTYNMHHVQDEGEVIFQLPNGHLMVGGVASRYNRDRTAFTGIIGDNGKVLARGFYSINGANGYGSILGITHAEAGHVVAIGQAKSIDHDTQLLITKIKIDDKTGMHQSVWKKDFGTKGYDVGRDVVQLSDGNYLLLGSKHQGGEQYESAPWLLKINGQGDVIWEKVLPTTRKFQNAQALIADENGGAYIALNTHSAGLVWHMDDNGQITNKQDYPKVYIYDMVQSATGPILAAQITVPTDRRAGGSVVHESKGWVAQLDKNLAQKWATQFETTETNAIAVNQKGEVYITGYRHYRGEQNNVGHVIKFDPKGNIEWSSHPHTGYMLMGNDIIVLNDQAIATTGRAYTKDKPNNHDVFVMRSTAKGAANGSLK